MKKIVFNIGDNVLIPQTKDNVGKPNVNAIVKEVRQFELVVEVDESFTIPVPKKYCVKV